MLSPGRFKHIQNLGCESRSAIYKVIDSFLTDDDFEKWKVTCRKLNDELALRSCWELRNSDRVMMKKNGFIYSGPTKGVLQDTYDEYGMPLKKNGQFVYGTQKWKTGEQYSGQWKIGKYHGNGTLIKFYNGKRKTMKGQWHFGEMGGHGTCQYADGSFYVGNWANNYRSGNGKHTFKTGGYYDGEWLRDSKHGTGILKNEHMTYSGQWHWGKQHGLGILEKEMTKYEGLFEGNQKHGHGTMIYGDGSIYRGNFTRNSRTGYGTMVYVKRYGRSLSRYEGLWLGDKRRGLGTSIFTDGRVYKGVHVYNRLYDNTGTALMTWPDGKKCTAFFENNEPVFNGVAEFFDNDTVVDIKSREEMKTWLANARKTNKRKRDCTL
mgnify:CR=1 FL=1